MQWFEPAEQPKAPPRVPYDSTPFDLVRQKALPGDRGMTPDGASPGCRSGDVIAGKYELVRPLGHGGMSSVWVVTNRVLEAQFALKLVRNDGGDANAAERMLREARSAARLEHPAIIRVFDFGVTERSDPFLVMELLPGTSLRERLRTEGPLSPVEAVRLLLPIADALSVAHSRGIVHRDLKPDHVMIVPTGEGHVQPKLIDFGIAKQLDQDARTLTQVGTIVGSPEYMSPEQAGGLLGIGPQTDVWSFCVMLFETITGTTPFFRGDAVEAVLHAIMEEPPPSIDRFGVHEPALWSILSRGLEKFPSARWDDMRSLGTALARWLLQRGIEEDACMRSLRAAWPQGSESAPPLALDAGAERARLAALSAPVHVPKRGLLRTFVGVAAVALAATLITASMFRASRPSNMSRAEGATRAPVAPSAIAAPSEPVVVPVPSASLTAHAPLVGASSPLPESAVASAAPPAGVASAPPPPATATRAAPPSERHERAKPSPKRLTTEKEANTAAAPPPRPMTVPELAPPPAAPADTTVMPDVKPPPAFDDDALHEPYAKPSGSSNGSNDNPYR